MNNSCSSSDDDDDVPLLKIKLSSNSDPNSYEQLCARSKESCELCEHVSKNKYKSLIHNVRHIIIPLINQKVFQCGICLHHFTAQQALNRHISHKHNINNFVIKLPKKNLVMLGSDSGPAKNNITKDLRIPENNKTLRNNLEQENVINNNKDGTKEFKPELFTNKILRNKDDGISAIIIKEEVEAVETIQVKDEHKENIVKSAKKEVFVPSETSGKVSIKSRLLFEEDIDTQNCEQLLTDLTTDCKVNVEWFPPIWQIEDNERSRSVHYDELVKPGLFRCNKCGKRFPSRYEAIIHESQHIYIKKSQVNLCEICNRYILGDISKLSYHKRKSHPKTYYKAVTEKKYYGAKQQQNGGVSYNESIIKLCNPCFYICKNKNAGCNSYEPVGEMQDPVLGKIYECSKCLKKCLHVILVSRKTWCYGKREVEKKITNEDRLKMIVKRFKMMK